jgi:hypothetical protein
MCAFVMAIDAVCAITGASCSLKPMPFQGMFGAQMRPRLTIGLSLEV